MRYWSLSAFAKQHVKTAVNVVSTFEESVARECKRRKLDGVVCGHIHHAEIRDIDGVTYLNCGDWVESCTALAEDENGQINIIRWVELDHLNQSPADLPIQAALPAPEPTVVAVVPKPKPKRSPAAKVPPQKTQRARRLAAG